MAPRQACSSCRRRKVKCDGLPTCRNCCTAEITCRYSPPQKRGPKPVKWQRTCPGEPSGPESAAADSLGEPGSPGIAPGTDTYSSPAFDSPLSNVITAALQVETTLESHTQTATRVHLALLAGLRAAAPSDEPASIANHCILLYTQFVFGIIPLCQETALRATVGRFFTSFSDGDNVVGIGDYSRISRYFATGNERERVRALRSVTLLTSLCAAVTYVVPASLLPNKHLTAPLFLQAARQMLRLYEDYDLEYPDSSSLSIRLFLSSAIQTASGTHGAAFHILNEAGLIAMRMRLYDESSLEGSDPVEENLLRNTFWHLYVCDKSALVMKARPVTIHESLFETDFTLKAQSRSPVPLFDPEGEPNSTGVEGRLLEGFHVIRCLWSMAARVIKGMELKSKRTLNPFTSMEADCESITQLSETYFEMITLTNNLPTLVSSPEQSSPDVNREADQHQYELLYRQRTTYLITLHSIKVLILKSAIQCNMTEVVGVVAEPLTLAMRQIELAQDFLNALESVPFLHLQVEGEHCAEKIRIIGSSLLELAHNADLEVAKHQAKQCAMRLIDMLVRLDSKASDILGHCMDFELSKASHVLH